MNLPNVAAQSECSDRDRESEINAIRAAETRRRFASIVTPEIVREHELSPLGEKSQDLLHLLEFMRQEPIAEKLAILTKVPAQSYQIIKLSGIPGVPNDESDKRRYSSEPMALHEVFLRRLVELGLWVRADEVATDLSMVKDPPEPTNYLIGYTDRLDVRPGESVDSYLSSASPISAKVDLVSLGDGEETGEVRETVIASLGDLEIRHQVTNIGSCAVVDSLATVKLLMDPVVGLIVQPTAPGRGRQSLISQVEAGDYWSLDIDDDGFAEVSDKRGEICRQVRATEPFLAGVWYAVAVKLGRSSLEIGVSRIERGRSGSRARVGTSADAQGIVALDDAMPDAGLLPGRMRFAARDCSTGWSFCYDGKLERALIASDVSAEDVVSSLVAGGPVFKIPGLQIVWDIAAAIDSGGIKTDAIPAFRGLSSGVQRAPEFDALSVNCPTWAVTSSAWDGSETSFVHAPHQWAAIHFHRDDLDDCRWVSNLKFHVPNEIRSGAYAVRISARDVPTERLPLFVESKSAGCSVAVIIPTASYMAYANDHPGTQAQMAQAVAGRTPVLMEGDMFLQEHPEFGRSCYDSHFDGSGVGYTSLRRPLLNMRPTHRYHVGAWQLPADLQLLSWLKDEELAYDVITDHTLHAKTRAALDEYSVILTTTHPEYYSTRMLDAVESWIHHGGRLLYLGGNGFYWRVAFDEDRPWVMEIRRGESGSRAWQSRPGESHHAFTGERGGLWSLQGRPPQETFGVGFCAQGFDSSGWYRRLSDSWDPRAEFIFADLDVETFGEVGREGGAAGKEIDRYDRLLGSPVDTLCLATSEGLSESYLRTVEEIHFLVSGTSAAIDPQVRADMTYFVNESGGAVFSTGSIAWCGSLGVDPIVSRITNNVLQRFVLPAPLVW